MHSVGPFSLPVAAVALAAVLAWLAARLLWREAAGRRAAALLLDALFIGLVAARAAYVLRWWPDYSAAPRAIVSIGDGGFYWWAGLPAGLAWLAWRTRGLPPLRQAALGSAAIGIAAWTFAQGYIVQAQRGSLPALALETLEARPVSLEHYSGRPVVINLWASWCPPCRREMPVLEQAQADYPGVRFLLINQGESAATVREFLAGQGLVFKDVLLDPASQAMPALRTRGLPTTLFFDAQGRLAQAHMGELTAARLRQTLQDHLVPPPDATRIQE
ncbi:prolipoprotein diacylglyceryl transferase family protein [Bordetella hinzii]|uniref:Redoxin n=1 Tax=Bordetella hinzii OH87 BAL007II TaxID=1331262 RepID=A0ABR4R958_9BORD|nr:TlpA disulfide reductase family protein [Bordetella hinzii]KCB26300.1 redoxin [Bordetella hinzii OH87 BAL007II]KCB41317.1 redoxin [Bordetella hinzii 5132]QDJ40438.1 redoxin [Bordetella hinzii]QDJ53911.1 redoxin [Bordetella hinzii]